MGIEELLSQKEVNNLLKRLDAVAKNGQVSRGTAMHFIRKSAWWLTHPSGPVREPGYPLRENSVRRKIPNRKMVSSGTTISAPCFQNR